MSVQKYNLNNKYHKRVLENNDDEGEEENQRRPPRIHPGDVDKHGADCPPQYVDGDETQLNVDDDHPPISETP